jgi:hypothetical protein
MIEESRVNQNQHTECPHCGTEYPDGVTAQQDGTCDWCPGVKTEPVEQLEPVAA